MKFTTSFALALPLLVSRAYGHYIFQILTTDGTPHGVYEFIRENSNQNSPVEDLTSNDLRCNVGADGSVTDTVEVAAGSEFAFTSDTAVYHQGPVTMYMAKAPSTASEYDGSGASWFKIKEIGPTFEGGSATWDLSDTYTGTIPAAVPDGEYLLRIEQLAIHNPGSTPQFYISCAQVSVTGGGAGEPAPLVEIPGHVSADDPGYTANIYNNFSEYIVPGPPVWSG